MAQIAFLDGSFDHRTDSLHAIVSTWRAHSQRQPPAKRDASSEIFLNDVSLKDTAVVKVLCQLAWDYSSRNAEKALAAAQEAVSIAQRVYQPSVLAAAPPANVPAIETTVKTLYANTLNVLSNIHRFRAEYAQALAAVQRARAFAETLPNKHELAISLGTLGSIYQEQGAFEQALELHLQALLIRESLHDKAGMAYSYRNIASVCRSQGDYTSALEYAFKVRSIRGELGDVSGLALIENDIGTMYRLLGRLDSALESYRHARALAISVRDKQNESAALNNMGALLLLHHQPDSAAVYHVQALALRTALRSAIGCAESLNDLAAAQLALQNAPAARRYTEQARVLADSLHLLPQLQRAYQLSAEVAVAEGNHEQAFRFERLYGKLKDSLVNDKSMRTIAAMRSQYQNERKNSEISALRHEQEREVFIRNMLLISAVALLITVALLVNRYRLKHRSEERYQEQNTTLRAANEELERQQELLSRQAADIEIRNTEAQQASLFFQEIALALERETKASHELLLSIMPAPIAERLKRGETKIAERFESVTVLFADLVGFTELAQRMRPERLVTLLNVVFHTFDRIVERHGNVEKIKTIGDCYMAVAGVPVPHPDHAEAVAYLALELLEAMNEFESDSLRSGLAVRIGIHTGAVVAGVIGRTKRMYDLWGDTVNTASRMESHSEPNRIHVTEDVYALLNDSFVFEQRGAIDVKGKGAMNTYFLLAAKRPFAPHLGEEAVGGGSSEISNDEASASIRSHKPLTGVASIVSSSL